MYYLIDHFWHLSILATGNWPELEYAHIIRFSKLMEYYQDTVLVDKQEKQEYSRRMTPKKHRFSNLTVIYPIEILNYRQNMKKKTHKLQV